jgi:hypothetical protein
METGRLTGAVSVIVDIHQGSLSTGALPTLTSRELMAVPWPA